MCCVKRTCWQKSMLGHEVGQWPIKFIKFYKSLGVCGGRGVGAGGGYKTFSKWIISKINSACVVTLDPSAGIVKCLCGRQTCTSFLEKKKKAKKKAVDSPLEIVWKCAWWDKAEDGEGGKEIGFLFVACIDFDQNKPIYFALNIYYFQYPPHHLKIQLQLTGSFREKDFLQLGDHSP